MPLESGIPARSMGELETVFDMDFHAAEDPEQLIPYLPDEWQRTVSNSEFPAWYDHEPHVPNPVSAGKLRPDPDETAQHNKVDSREDVIQGMKEVRADHIMLTPGGNLGLPTIPNEEFAVASAHAFNSWVLNDISDGADSDGIHSSIVVCSRAPEEAVVEIDDRADERVFKAINVVPTGLHPPVGDRKYWPIYEAAERHGLPILLHGNAGAARWHYPHLHAGMSRFIENHAQSHPIIQLNQFMSLMANGVPERFDITFVFQEAGIGWLPFAAHRCDHVYRTLDDVVDLEKPPSEYIDDQFYVTSQPLEGINDTAYLTHTLRAMNAEENLMFASDYPHFDIDNPDHAFQQIQRAVGGEAAERIFGRTAMELFGI